MAVFQDLAAAVINYMNTKVTCSIITLAPNMPPLCNRNEGFKYVIRAQNNGTATDGVKLINVRFFVRSTSPTVKFKAPPTYVATARSGMYSSSPLISPGTMASQMYLFPNPSTGCDKIAIGSGCNLQDLEGNFGTTLGVVYFKSKIIAEPELVYSKNEDCPEGQIFRTVQA